MLALWFGIASAISLEKPFDLAGWTASGDYLQGNDVFKLGTKPGATAALWTQEQVPWKEWTFEVVLRTFAGDADPGNSGWGIFYTSNPLGEGALHGSSEYYDGLAITVDSMGWDEKNLYPDESKGAVRGHLSDGTVPFSSTPADQAFSLCRMPYRSTQGPIKLRVGHGRGVFIVEVNGQRCFSSDQIALPSGFFGISTSTGYSDDTFSLDQVKLTQGLSPDLEQFFDASVLEPAAAYAGTGQGSRAHPGEGGSPVEERAAPQAQAQAQATTVDLSPVISAINTLGGRIDLVQKQLDTSHNNLKEALALGGGSGGNNLDKVLEMVETINRMGERVESLEGTLRRQNDVTNEQIRDLHSKIDTLARNVDSHSTQLPASIGALVTPEAPSFWAPVGVLLVGQALVYIGYMSFIGRRAKHQKLL